MLFTMSYCQLLKNNGLCGGVCGHSLSVVVARSSFQNILSKNWAHD